MGNNKSNINFNWNFFEADKFEREMTDEEIAKQLRKLADAIEIGMLHGTDLNVSISWSK